MKREKSDGTAAGKRVNMQKPRASICKEFVLFNVLHNDARRRWRYEREKKNKRATYRGSASGLDHPVSPRQSLYTSDSQSGGLPPAILSQAPLQQSHYHTINVHTTTTNIGKTRLHGPM